MMQFLVPSNAPSNLQVKIADIRSQLPVNSKYSWISRNGVRDLRKLTTIVVHHDALSKASSKPYNDLNFASRIAQSHIRSEHNIRGGDPGFPYHVWVRNGTVYACNDLEALTYGVANNNAYTVHVCVSGNYAGVDKLTDADRNALYAAILMVKSMVPSVHFIKGHKEITPTACPGFSMNTVRTDVLHVEEQMSAAEDSKPARAYAIAARIDQLGQRLTSDKWGFSAQQKLGWLIEYVEGASVASDVVTLVGMSYKQKDYETVLELETIMRDKGLL